MVWNDDVLSRRSHIWHEMHLLPFTQVLGFVVCRTSSKWLGIGSAERSWSDVMKKDRKHSNLLCKSLDEKTTLYPSAKIEEACIFRSHCRQDPDIRWRFKVSKKNWFSSPLKLISFFRFDLELEKWGEYTTDWKESPTTQELLVAERIGRMRCIKSILPWQRQ